MAILTLIVFAVPATLVALAGRPGVRARSFESAAPWRAKLYKPVLGLLGCSLIFGVAFFLSWFNRGGSPHGLLPAPGAWKFLGPIATWLWLCGLVLSFLLKGRARLLLAAAGFLQLLATLFLFAAEMD